MPELISKYLQSLLNWRVFAVWAIASFAAAWSGPFGTIEVDSFAIRIAFWGLILGIGIALGVACSYVALAIAGPTRVILRESLAVWIMALVFTPVLSFVAHRVLPERHDISSMPELFVDILAIAALIAILRYVLTFGSVATPWLSRGSDDARPRLEKRLPHDFRGPVLHIQKQDDQVTVVSAADSCQLRMRFSDAVAEMDSVQGFSTHRAHWVALNAIASVSRSETQVALLLVTGDWVPVSRRYQAALFEAGIL